MALSTLADLPQLYRQFAGDIAFVQPQGYRRARWSYRRTAELAFRFARELESRGIAKGDAVMIWGANSAEWAATFFGCMLRGGVAVPMDRIAAPDFVQRVAADVNAKLVVCSGEVAAVVGQWPTVVLEDLSSTPSRHSAEPYPPVPLTRDDIAEIVFTSGTTAEPRGVVLTHGNVLSSLEPIANELPKYKKYERIFHPIRFLELLPLSHVFGQFMGIFIPPLIGGTVQFYESMNPAEIIATIKKERISVLIAVPRVAESLKQKIERDFPQEFGAKLETAGNIRFLARWWRFRKIHRHLGWKFWALIVGGAALDKETEEFWRKLGYGVIQGYGLTETSSLVSLNHPFRIGRQSIGKVLPGREVKLDEKTGEILVRGENVARSYWQRGELRPVVAQSEEDEGWYRTGDLGELDAEGNLYFKGRSKDVIVTPAGLKIFPEDLESALRRQPDVRDSVAFGITRGGNAEPCAVLLVKPGESAAAAVERANKSLADFQKIRCWMEWPEEDFPRTSTQKPKLGEIRAAAEAKFSSGAPVAAPAGSLQELVQRVAGRKIELRRDAHLDSDLGLSSLERVELMSALEDRYQVDLSDRQFVQVNTVAELEQLVSKASPAEKAPPYPYARWALRWPIRWLPVLGYYLLTRPAMFIMSNPKILGREKLKDVRGPALIVANHTTRSDVGFVQAALPPRLRNHLAAAMQGEMLRDMRYPPRDWFFLRRWSEQLQYVLISAVFDVFPLPHSAGFRESFQYAGELVDRGYSVLVFPEGKRTQTGEMAPFRSGIGLLVQRLNLPIIPMRIDGLFPLKQRKQRFSKPGTVQVRVGEPVRFAANKDPEEIARELQEIVKSL
jgi:long-chain acyl-CoA synthetase